MAKFLIHHHHDPCECAASNASWLGFSSPLRGTIAPSACRFGDHENWWQVSAPDPEGAIAQVPAFVGARATVTRIEDRPVP